MTSAVAEIQTLFQSTQLRIVPSLKVPCTWESTNPAAKRWYLAKAYPFHPSCIWKVTCNPGPSTSYWRHSRRKSVSLKAVMYEVTDVISFFIQSKQAKANAADSPSRLPQSSRGRSLCSPSPGNHVISGWDHGVTTNTGPPRAPLPKPTTWSQGSILPSATWCAAARRVLLLGSVSVPMGCQSPHGDWWWFSFAGKLPFPFLLWLSLAEKKQKNPCT